MAIVPFHGAGPQPLDKVQWVKFKNNYGSQIPANAVLKITGFVTTDPEEPYFTVTISDAFGAQYSHAINDNYPVSNGSYGRCCLGAIVPAWYYEGDGTPAFGEIWGPQASSFALHKNTGGFVVLGVVDTTNKLVLVRPMPFLSFHGTAGADIAAGAAGLTNIYYRSGASAYTSAGWTTSALNALDVTVASGSEIDCLYDGDGTNVRWKIIQAHYTCP